MKTSRKFVTSPDILVPKGKNSVANVTVLVAISSPVKSFQIRTVTMNSRPRLTAL